MRRLGREPRGSRAVATGMRRRGLCSPGGSAPLGEELRVLPVAVESEPTQGLPRPSPAQCGTVPCAGAARRLRDYETSMRRPGRPPRRRRTMATPVWVRALRCFQRFRLDVAAACRRVAPAAGRHVRHGRGAHPASAPAGGCGTQQSKKVSTQIHGIMAQTQNAPDRNGGAAAPPICMAQPLLPDPNLRRRGE